MKIEFDFEKIEAFAKDLKQTDLAKEFGISQQTVSHRLKNHRESTATRFCRYL